jgi:ATP-dependent Lhr-like helicase
MTKRPPHIVVTTPESLFILLTSDGGRRMLSTLRTVIVDEIHAIVGDKRGAHLALSLERLDELVRTTSAAKGGTRSVQRIGLSATQRPIERVAKFLVGASGPCTIVDGGHKRQLDLKVELPRSPLEAVMAGEVWEEIYDRLATLVSEHKTTLLFVNTRRLAERLTRHLAERIGKEHVTSHHGSLSKEHRLAAEQRLKHGQLKALVATASLELGIDIGDVDLVCQVGVTRSIAALLQRVGRSGHHKGGLPKGRLFPLTRDELVESAALLDAIRRGELDEVRLVDAPLDILAQQIVAASATDERDEDALYELMRRAAPYEKLQRKDFDAVVQILADGYSTRRGRRGAHIHRDAVNGKLRGRKGARLAATMSGGAIPDIADYEVVLDPTGERVGTLNEDFAIESMAGDIFQLGNMSWKILRVLPGVVRVEDARGQPPSIPFWLGEAPSRSHEFSYAVSRLRKAVDDGLGPAPETNLNQATIVVSDLTGLNAEDAGQLVNYLAAGRNALGVMPSDECVVLERFFDETGGMQLVLHSPFGSRVNRAWGLCLRKKFCQKFNFELQAAATEDALVLSLGPTHAFELSQVFSYLKPGQVKDSLVQALLPAPMFATRWRWNANRSLAVLRYRGGKKVPPRFQRMDADDLLTVVFPDQVACQDNIQGPREVPDHPLVNQTLHDCMVEAMDLERFEQVLARIVNGQIRGVAKDLTEPSPFSHEILTARPYAFLDDAPLEERRTQAVLMRRAMDATSMKDLCALDPQAIARAQLEVWPEMGNADELHDALVIVGFLKTGELSGAAEPLQQLIDSGRCANIVGTDLWIAAERIAEHRAVRPALELLPAIVPPGRIALRDWEPVDALAEILRGRLESTGPVTTAEVATDTVLPEGRVAQALLALQAQGAILPGTFRPQAAAKGEGQTEWCERRLLARIHRYTLGRLRNEIQPVTQQEFVRFLLSWQRAEPSLRGTGPDFLLSVIEQLQGVEAPVAAWEESILPARVDAYEPAWLDQLCLSGRIVWHRRSPALPGPRGARAAGPVRATPIALTLREHLPTWSLPLAEVPLSPVAQAVAAHLASRGASFFDELPRATGHLKTEVENALGELAAAGRVTSDSFAGLRALITPESKKRQARRPRGSRVIGGMESAGRWALLAAPNAEEAGTDPAEIEQIAWALLKRTGVVFRRVVEKQALPPWRDLLREYRRLEARGEIRGGRFVEGYAGEQFALPGAVEELRASRRRDKVGSLVSLSAADPLNVVGTLLPGARVSAIASNRVLLRDGVLLARKSGDDVAFFGDVPAEDRWELTQRLLGRERVHQLKPRGRARAAEGRS